MITFSVIKEVVLDKAKRVLKVQQFGVKTADHISSFGDDASPLNDMVAIYADTSEIGDSVIIGYLNKNQISKQGEKRIFSLKNDGSISFAIHLKNDGTCEIGEGASDNLVRFSELKKAFDQLKTDFNTFAQKYNTHTHVSGSAGSPNAPILPPMQAQNSNADLANAKVEEVKVL